MWAAAIEGAEAAETVSVVCGMTDNLLPFDLDAALAEAVSVGAHGLALDRATAKAINFAVAYGALMVDGVRVEVGDRVLVQRPAGTVTGRIRGRQQHGGMLDDFSFGGAAMRRVVSPLLLQTDFAECELALISLVKSDQ